VAYHTGSISVNGPKGTELLFPKLKRERSYVTPAGIRAAGPSRILGQKVHRVNEKPGMGEETENE
jgi:hypothetical protein